VQAPQPGSHEVVPSPWQAERWNAQAAGQNLGQVPQQGRPEAQVPEPLPFGPQPMEAQHAGPAAHPTVSPPWSPTPEEMEQTRLDAPAGAPAGLRLVFDTGERVEVRGPGAVGRDVSHLVPRPVHPVVIEDPTRSISRVHLRFGPEPTHDALWVLDEGSTNGTVLLRPDGAAVPLPPGVRATLTEGWQIQLGDRRVAVERVPSFIAR